LKKEKNLFLSLSSPFIFNKWILLRYCETSFILMRPEKKKERTKVVGFIRKEFQSRIN